MTFTRELSDKVFTRIFWQMCTECVTPYLGWFLAQMKIGTATAAKMAECRLDVWPHHVIFGAEYQLLSSVKWLAI